MQVNSSSYSCSEKYATKAAWAVGGEHGRRIKSGAAAADRTTCGPAGVSSNGPLFGCCATVTAADDGQEKCCAVCLPATRAGRTRQQHRAAGS